jgi:thiol:disulfide interchange protein
MTQRSRILVLYAIVAAMAGFGISMQLPMGAFLNLGSTVSDHPSAFRNTASNHPVEWASFSQATLQSNLAAGRIVLVFFQADWDMTSKFAESHFAEEDLQQLMWQHRVVALEVDCTRENHSESVVLRKSLGLTPIGVVPVVAIFPREESTPTVVSGVDREELFDAVRAAVQ